MRDGMVRRREEEGEREENVGECLRLELEAPGRVRLLGRLHAP